MVEATTGILIAGSKESLVQAIKFIKKGAIAFTIRSGCSTIVTFVLCLCYMSLCSTNGANVICAKCTGWAMRDGEWLPPEL